MFQDYGDYTKCAKRGKSDQISPVVGDLITEYEDLIMRDQVYICRIFLNNIPRFEGKSQLFGHIIYRFLHYADN